VPPPSPCRINTKNEHQPHHLRLSPPLSQAAPRYLFRPSLTVFELCLNVASIIHRTSNKLSLSLNLLLSSARPCTQISRLSHLRSQHPSPLKRISARIPLSQRSSPSPCSLSTSFIHPFGLRPRKYSRFHKSDNLDFDFRFGSWFLLAAESKSLPIDTKLKNRPATKSKIQIRIFRFSGIGCNERLSHRLNHAAHAASQKRSVYMQPLSSNTSQSHRRAPDYA